MRLSEIPDGARLLIDANIFIYALRERSRECAALLRRCARREVERTITAYIFAEVVRRLMVSEAIVKGILKPPHAARELKRRWREVCEKLRTYREQAEAILQMGLELLPPSPAALARALSLQERFGLMAGDSLNLAIAEENGIKDVASNDADLLRVEGFTIWRPGDLPP